ncbi:cell wall metabolism sensor histidine kinase WalK [Actinomyces sp. oral taxon 414]|uniref:sensor histidine kinase n=1 Tax=Actinomyces sp. oral taxon 414 TaxID=712122 RepID=UPI00209F0C7E|nr:HAMP domain-containing sensor histidine kinase [Actinomyces sp. oral taxon 414]
MTTARRTWHTLPLRSRLALITTGLLTVGLLVVSLAITSLLYTHLLGQVDDQLRVTSQAIGSRALEQIRTGNKSLMPSTYYVEAQYLDGQTSYMISDDTAAKYGVPVIDVPSLNEAKAQFNAGELRTVGSSKTGFEWRVICLPFIDGTGNYLGVVAIALPLSDIREAVERTRFVVALADVAVILVGAMAATYLVHRSFRSLRQIEGVAGRIAGGDLSARVPVTEPSSTEVGSLQRALNMMLQQNEKAFSVQVVAQERMTRFVSDASHELRTPLAAIRGYGELYRMGGVPPERQSEVMGRIEDEASRMGRLVEDLLQLARIDEGRKMTMERVDLTAVCSGALTDMTVLAPDRACTLIPLTPNGKPAPAVVIGDRDRLSQVITNLLGNVVRHTPPGTPAEIAVGPVGENAVVEVRDHGPGVDSAEADKVFQRFYRADSSRNRKTGGSGLGLAIVLAIIKHHGGSVRILQTPGGGATVHLEVPLAPTM